MAAATRLLWLDLSVGAPRALKAGDTVDADGAWTFSEDAVFEKNVVVQGTMTVTQSEEVLISDNHLYLNYDYETAVAQTGGLVVNYLPTATTDSVNGAFTAGVAGVSNPTVVTTGSGTFSAGDLIQITGANKPENNGLFEVLSHSGTTLTIRGIGLTGCVEDFTQNQFVSDATVAGSICKVNVSVLRSGTSGNWEVGKGSNSPSPSGITFTPIATGEVSETLQEAYENGNTITTSGTHGNIAFSGTEDFTVGGDMDVSFDTTGSISFDADAASNFSVAGAGVDLTLSSAGGQVIVDGGEAAANAVRIVASNAAGGIDVDSGTAGISVATTGGIEIDAASDIDIESSGGSISIGSDNANQPIFIGDGGSRTITVGQLGANTNVLVNASLIDLASDAGGSFTSNTNSGSDKNLVFSAANSGAGGAWITIDAKSGVEINSTAGPLNIGNDPVSQPISIGTGAAARTITIGNATSTTGLTLQSGTGAIKASSTVAGAHASGAAAWTLEATGTNGGDVGFFVGAGSPNGVVTGAKGDVFFDVNSPAIYICTATGTTWVALSSATGTTLQVAYENGNTITTSSAEGALAITTGSGAPIQFTLTGDDFTVNGANDVDFGGTTALSTFNLDTTGAITVDSSSSGVSIGAVDTSDFTVAANSAGNKTLNLVATNSGTGTAGVIIGTTGFATDYVSAYAGQIGLTAYRGEGYSSVQISSASDDDEAAVEISAEGATEGRVHISASSWLSGYVHSGLLAFGHYYANNTGAVIGAGRLVCTDTNSTLQVKYAQATAGGGGSNLTSRITGVTLESISNGASGRVTTVHGSVVDVVFSVAVAASDQGKVAYLGTNGQAVLDISGYGSGDYVVEVGIVQGPNSGAGTAAKVLFAPRFVAAIP